MGSEFFEKQRILSDQGTRASTTFSGVVSTAVPHVPEVRTITRFSNCSINKAQTTGKKNRSIQTTHNQKARVRVHTWARGRERSFEGANRRKECVPKTLLSYSVREIFSNSESSNPRWCCWKVHFFQRTKNCTTPFVAHQQTLGDTKEYACTWNFCPTSRAQSRVAQSALTSEL